MDPLSVAASVIGLPGAAGKVRNLLEITSAARSSPAAIRDAQTETWTRHNAKTLCLDELVVSLSDATLVLSEFESLLALLSGMTRTRTAILWFKYSKQIDEHIEKTQRNKASLTFMLNILQCESDLEALQNQERLQLLVEQTLDDSNELKQELGRLKDPSDARSKVTRRDQDQGTIVYHNGVDRDDISTIRGISRPPQHYSKHTEARQFKV